MKTYKLFRALAPLALLALVACGGSTNKTPAAPGQPLDPQGNWEFVLTSANGSTTFAGQLYELHPPVVTSNGMWGASVQCAGGGSLYANGQASGVADISLTLTQQLTPSGAPLASYTLTGTIADDQAHMSGAWSTTNTNGCTVDTTGTWSAKLLTPFSGNYTGQLSNDDIVNMSLTENTDQTSPNMGALSGSVAFQSSCISDASVAVNSSVSYHGGFNVSIITAADARGATAQINGALTDDGAEFQGQALFSGGPCNGQTLAITEFKR